MNALKVMDADALVVCVCMIGWVVVLFVAS